MNNTRDSFLNNTAKRIIYVVSAFLLLYLVVYLMDPFSVYWDTFFTRPGDQVLLDLMTSLLFCFLISESSINIGKWLNTKISWTQYPGKRLAAETILNLTVVMLINQLFSLICPYIFADQPIADNNPLAMEAETREMLRWVLVSIVISLMIMGINIGNYLVVNWKNEAIRSAELSQVAMEAELQSLKLQIDPHFVFNNLSVLSELILENQQVGYEYAENFSRIYRYLLVNAKKDVLTLDEELKFLTPYRYLIQQRFGDGVQFDIQVDPQYRSYHLPPLTLQLLVENALKHNKTSKRDPLQIRIHTTDAGELLVENTLLPLGKEIPSSGIGIKNIKRRYKLLSTAEPNIQQDEDTFAVTLPLFKL
ncbi:histidine kinase [Sphingobacterium sp. lm-10]|uniref:sensor histidine kinase n=1 Tax=Sphingobacterium sp. lm-10 TaxID=2944904 RepID=UPI0020209577|nr:histidine kinase [Sphingobacterium sp. lm-10]MCL7989310.1 histidine kinase [Sphingobacterium sp. lm-10]